MDDDDINIDQEDQIEERRVIEFYLDGAKMPIDLVSNGYNDPYKHELTSTYFYVTRDIFLFCNKKFNIDINDQYIVIDYEKTDNTDNTDNVISMPLSRLYRNNTAININVSPLEFYQKGDKTIRAISFEL